MSPAVADFYSPVFAACDDDRFSESVRFRLQKEGGVEGGLTRTRPRRPRLIKVRRKQGRSNESKGEGDHARGSDGCYWNGVVDGGGVSGESVGKENCAIGNGGTVRGEHAGRMGVLETEGFGSVGNENFLDEKLEKVEYVFGAGGKDVAARKGRVGSRAVRKLAKPVRESEADDEGASVDLSLRNLKDGKRGEGEEVGYSGFNFNAGAIVDNGVKGALYGDITDHSGEVANIGSNNSSFSGLPDSLGNGGESAAKLNIQVVNSSFSGLPDSLGNGGESAAKLNIQVVNNAEDSGKSKESAGNEWKTENGPILHQEYVFGSSWSSDLKVDTQESQEYPHRQDTVHNARGRLETSAESQNGESENPPLIFGQNSNLNGSKGPAVCVFKGDVGKSSDQCKIRTSGDRLRSGVHSNRSSIINSEAGNAMVNDRSVLYQDNSSDTGGSYSIFDLPKGMNNLNLHDCLNLDSGKRTDTSASDSCVAAKLQFIFGNGPTLSNPETVGSGNLNFQTLENPFFVEFGGFDSFRKDLKNVNKDMFVFGRTPDFAGDSGDIPRDDSFTFQAEVNESSDQDKYSHTSNGFDTSVHRLEETESSTLTSGASPSSPLGGLDLPNFDTSCLRASLFSEQKHHFSKYAKPYTGKKAKRKNRRLRPPSSEKLPANNHCVSGTSVFSEDRGTSSYSPMDSSPYQETAAEGPDVSAATLGVADGPKGGSTTFQSSLSISNDGTSYTTSSPKSEANVANFNGKETVDVAENGSCIPPNTDRKATHSEDQVVFTSGSRKIDQQSFIFSSSSSAHVSMKDKKQLCKKKIKVKSSRANSAVTSARSNVGCGTSFTQSSRMSDTSTGSDLNRGEDEGASSEVKGGERVNLNIRTQVQKNSLAASGVQEACDKWRLRGNQSYKCGNFTKAEEFYTNGINAVPSGEKSMCCLKPLLLCYSNRAATRVSLGRIREAIEDCLMASALDRDFLKVQLRTANCHLMLGEVEDASVYFNKCLVSGADVCLDRRLIIDAADGLRKAQKVTECMNASSIILEEKTVDAATKVIEIITEALSISKFSEKLLESKAEALHILQKHQEVIQLCQKSLSFAEINFPAVGIAEGCFLSKLWRSFFVAKSHFCLGRLEEALDLLEKVKQFGSSCDKLHMKYLKSSISLATIIRKLQQCKNAGNEAFHSGKYAEAVEHYSNALLCNVESRSFAAVCFCNRAASFQALGQIADAIADCSVAIALDGHYTKAIHRRATLHELIRDYGQASADTQRLVYVLESQRTKPSTSGSGDNRANELRKVRKHWSALEEEGKNGGPLDYYLILGVKLSNSSSDIKKAYHKAALRHHPDKAGQLLSRSESCSGGRLWKELSKGIHDDADRLFKLIGEAYAVLSDPSKRSQYDHEEEIRKAREGRDHGSYPSKFNASPSGRSTQRQWGETWRTYGYSDSRR